MKKIIAIVAVIVGLLAPSLIAANLDNETVAEIQKDRDYIKVANHELPDAIRADIGKEHKDAVVEEVYVAPQDNGEKLYRIKLRHNDGDESTVYYEKNEKGEYKHKVAFFQKIGDKIKD